MYFTVSIKVKFEDDKGRVKSRTERYLVDAVSVTDSEAMATAHMVQLGEKDFEISSSSQSKIISVIMSEDQEDNTPA